MNYLSFFELVQEPFSNAPVSRFYYGSQQHGRAIVRLMHAVESMKGLAVVIGETGAGKTTTARRLLESLPEDQYEAALLVLVQSGVSAQWLVTKIAYQLGVSQPAEDKTRLLGQLYRRLYAIHESGKKAVVLIDEAQMMNSRELMEEVRGLLNMEIPDQKLLTLVMFGLPDLEDHLKLDPPLYQRVAVRCKLDPLSAEATEAYIKHRLKLAGATRMLFTQEAVRAVHRASSGIPRLINTLCDNALFEGLLSRTNPITARVIESVVAELGYDGVTERGGFRAGPPSPWAGFAGDAGGRAGTSRPDISVAVPSDRRREGEPGGVSPGGGGTQDSDRVREVRSSDGGISRELPLSSGRAPFRTDGRSDPPRTTGVPASPEAGKVSSTPRASGSVPSKSDEIDSILSALENK